MSAWSLKVKFGMTVMVCTLLAGYSNQVGVGTKDAPDSQPVGDRKGHSSAEMSRDQERLTGYETPVHEQHHLEKKAEIKHAQDSRPLADKKSHSSAEMPHDPEIKPGDKMPPLKQRSDDDDMVLRDESYGTDTETQLSSIEQEKEKEEKVDFHSKLEEEIVQSLSRETGIESESGHNDDNNVHPREGIPFSNKLSRSEADDQSSDEKVSEGVKPVASPPTKEEIKAESLYLEGIKKINSSQNSQIIRAGYQQLLEASELGHGKAKVEVAFARLHGHYLPMDIEGAKKILTEEAEKGSPQAQAGLAFLCSTGILTNSSQAKALVYLTFSALGGDTMGRMMLGYKYWAGITLQQNCESALTYYGKVADEVAAGVSMSGGAMVHRVRILDEVESSGSNVGRMDEDLVQYYQFLADKGDVHAQVGLGQLHYQGARGFMQNMEKAYEYFTLASTANNANAQAYLGKMYAEGSATIKPNNATALEYFKKAADQGNPVGQAGLGTMHLLGKGIPIDYKTAFKYFQMSADQGWAEGQLQLGNMYYLGLGVKRDYKQAVRYFNLASQSGHVLALYNLAQMHATGTGVPRSCHVAVELSKNVCERGRWSILFDIAYQQYQEGKVDSALVIYLMLAELGYEVAQSNVAHILDQKESTLLLNESYARALIYWNRAATQGYTTARIKLGDYHYYGYGTEVDFETAATHYKVASEQSNNAQAMFNLGYMHEQGLGLKQDFHLAKRFYDLAAEASPDAQAPVMLALFKVGVLYALEYVKELGWKETMNSASMQDYVSEHWDVYVMTIAALLLGFVIAYHRQHVAQPQPAQR